jgi:hypothetical protein
MADHTADWVLIATGYDPAALKHLTETEPAPDALIEAGARPSQTNGLYSLSYAATAADVLRSTGDPRISAPTR